MVFPRSLNKRKSSPLSRTLLSILADINNALVWMVSTRPLISPFSSPCTNLLVTVPSVPITIGITVTSMFHSFLFSSPKRFWYLSLFSLSFSFTLWLAGTAKSSIRQALFFFFLLTISKSGRLAEISWSVWEFWASHFLGQILGCAYTIRSYNQISVSCTILSGSSCPSSHVLSHVLFTLIYSIRLLYDWSFRLYHHVIYICYFCWDVSILLLA